MNFPSFVGLEKDVLIAFFKRVNDAKVVVDDQAGGFFGSFEAM